MKKIDYSPGFRYYFIDLFCGFGGTSYGITQCEGMAQVIWAVNHDKKAIASHQLNNPYIKHSIEDIRTLDLSGMLELVNEIRRRNPFAVICIWASLECTNHSNAKGGMSRDADSRTLANDLLRYIDTINPEMLWIENVREFLDWGPLEHQKKNGVPQFVKKGPKKGEPVMVPIRHLKTTYYKPWVKKIRDRGYQYEHVLLNSADFGAYTRRKRLFIQFAKPEIAITWPKPTHDEKGRNGLEKWKAVKDVLQLDELGESVFRNPPLCDNTITRVRKGVHKHNDAHFFIKYYSSGGQWASVNEPCHAVTTKDRFGLCSQFLISHYSDGRNAEITGSSPSILTNPKEQLTSVQFLLDMQYGNLGTPISKTCGTLIASMAKKEKYLVTGQHIMRTHFSNIGTSIEEPSNSLTADRHRDYLMTSTIELTLPEIHWSDTQAVKALKYYMIHNGIGDIKMRGLFIEEMLQIMGLPADYAYVGSKTDAKKFIGNAVETNTAREMVLASFRKNQHMCEAIA